MMARVPNHGPSSSSRATVRVRVRRTVYLWLRASGWRERARERETEPRRSKATPPRNAKEGKVQGGRGAAAALEFAYVREKEGAEQPLLREAQHHKLAQRAPRLPHSLARSSQSPPATTTLQALLLAVPAPILSP